VLSDDTVAAVSITLVVLGPILKSQCLAAEDTYLLESNFKCVKQGTSEGHRFIADFSLAYINTRFQ